MGNASSRKNDIEKDDIEKDDIELIGNKVIQSIKDLQQRLSAVEKYLTQLKVQRDWERQRDLVANLGL